MTTILSIYAGPHDAAIAVVKNGEVLVNLEKERITRKKYDGGFSIEIFDKILNNFHINHEEIDYIVIDGKVGSKIPSVVQNTEGIPWNDIVALKKKTVYKGSCDFYSRKIPLFSIHHHLSHAAGSYFTSPFKNAVILTADAGGMGYNFSTAIAKNGYFQPLEFFWTTPLGWWWAKLPEYYGVQNPGTLMAIGAYGKENNILKNELLGQMFIHATSGINKQNINIGRKVNSNGIPIKPLNPKINKEADLALALQNITDDIFTGWFKQTLEKGNKNLCFSGGLALNCISNSRAAINVEVEKFHVPPNPNDSGIAMGAGLALYYYVLKNQYIPKYFNPYRGLKYSLNEINSVIQKAQKNNKNLKVKKASNELISDLLAEGFIIARFFGRSEAGPRALGQRSFIASPNIKDLRIIMNRVKKREWYRPFAPIILKSEAENVLENVLNNSYYMNTSSLIRKEWREMLAGVSHVDNTTRPQLIDENSSKDLLQIVEMFFKKTGIPAILNTSFNIEEPLVETPEQAMNTFLKISSDVKFLQLENFLIEKV